MKSIKTICSFKASFWTVCLSILLLGFILLGQGSGPRFHAEAHSTAPSIDDLTMEEFVDMGRRIVFGSWAPSAGHKAIGKGQCPLCHTFNEGDNIGRCPNLFGVEERSHSRIREYRYRNEPIRIGETDPASGIVKGKPDQLPEEYSRLGSPEMTGEDYLRESMMCPSCYIVDGYGKAGDTKSPMPLIHKPPIRLSWIELNAVIAFLQSKDTPGDYSRVTVSLPTPEEIAFKTKSFSGNEGHDSPDFVPCEHPRCLEEMINALGCPLCHTIPGVQGAVGELGPPLRQDTDILDRILSGKYQGNARTVREYIKESIVNPNAYIMFNEEAGEPYVEGVMPQDYANKLSPKALETLVDFISNTQPKKK